MLVLHSLVRWIVVGLGLFACARALSGWAGKRAWTPADSRAGLLFMISVDVQLLFGLVLYVAVSPITHAALQDFGAAMRDDTLRFYAVEHSALGLLALVAVHATRLSIRRVEGTARHKRTAIGFVIACLLVLATVPWPFLARGAGRPWLRI